MFKMSSMKSVYFRTGKLKGVKLFSLQIFSSRLHVKRYELALLSSVEIKA